MKNKCHFCLVADQVICNVLENTRGHKSHMEMRLALTFMD